jgi:beta-galactoside alpha-2,3-sialyltransferase (sialyltransferase 4A)
MVVMRKRIFKLLTFLVLLIFITSFFLNYSSTGVPTTWFPKQMVLHLSANLRKLIKSQPCTCAHCISQSKVSDWFDQRFNRTMQPLLTVHNAALQEDTYQWWMVRLVGISW